MHLLLIEPIRPGSCRTLWRRSPCAASTPAHCGSQEFMHRIFGIFQIGQHARLRRTGFATRRGQTFRNAVVTERALVGRIGLRVEKAAAVGASLDAVAAAEAILLVHQDYTVRRVEGRAYGADLYTRRVRAMIAEFRDEE